MGNILDMTFFGTNKWHTSNSNILMCIYLDIHVLMNITIHGFLLSSNIFNNIFNRL